MFDPHGMGLEQLCRSRSRRPALRFAVGSAVHPFYPGAVQTVSFKNVFALLTPFPRSQQVWLKGTAIDPTTGASRSSLLTPNSLSLPVSATPLYGLGFT